MYERKLGWCFCHAVCFPPLIVFSLSFSLSLSKPPPSDEYKMKGVEEVKYMRGDENRVNARNQENLVRLTQTHWQTHTDSDCFLTASQANRLLFVSKGSSSSLTHRLLLSVACLQKHTKSCLTCILQQHVCVWTGELITQLVQLWPVKPVFLNNGKKCCILTLEAGQPVWRFY